METLCELGLSQMTKVLTSSLLHIPTTVTTPIIEKSASAEILSATVEDEIDFFVTGDIEDNDIDFSETLDVIDSAYKNIKYKKIKDILLRDIKNDVSEFIQNIIKTKLENKIKPAQQRRISKSCL